MIHKYKINKLVYFVKFLLILILLHILYDNSLVLASNKAFLNQIGPNKIESQVLSKIISKQFADCSIILTYSSDKSKIQEIAHEVTYALSKTNYQSSLLILNFMTIEIPTFLSAFRNNFGEVNKLLKSCVASIIFINEVESYTFENLKNILIPHNDEITKKDEDYYIFVTFQRSLISQILLSQNFSLKIKYKLLILFENDNIYTFSACFYCKKDQGIVGDDIVNLNLILSINHTTSSRSEMFQDFTREFNGKNIIVSVAKGSHNHATIKEVKKGQYEKLRGSHFIALDNLKTIFNFTYSVRPSTGGGTGVMFPNKTWQGTTGDVYNNIADLGMVTGITFQRYKYIGFSYALSWEWLTFATRIPVGKISIRAIFMPFNLYIWLFILTSCLISILFLFYTLPNNQKNQNNHAWRPIRIVIGSLLEQDISLPPKTSLRIFIAFWLIFGILIGTAYRSKLISALAFPIITPPPTSFSELANSGYEVGLCYVGGAAYALFNTSTNPTYIKLAQIIELHNDVSECFMKVLEGDRACIGYESMAQYALAKNLTDVKGRSLIVVAPASTFFVSCGFALRRRVVYKTTWDKFIMKWEALGIISKWRDYDFELVRREKVKWTKSLKKEKRVGDLTNRESVEKLKLENLIFVFYILAIGLGISFLLYIFEIFKTNTLY